MLRLSIAGALHLVSQTSAGDGIVHTTAGGKDSALHMHMEIGADFENVFFGEHTQSSGTMTIGTITVQTTSNSTMVLTTGDGSVSMVQHIISRSEVTGQPPQPPQEHCMKCEVEHAKAPAGVKACLAALAADLKPTTTKSGLEGYAETMELAGGAATSTLFFDSAGLLHEVSSETVVKVPGQPNVTTTFDIPLQPTAGSPDPARFAVDPAWKCEAPPTGPECPAPPPGAAPQMLQVYKCFADAIERAQVQGVVV